MGCLIEMIVMFGIALGSAKLLASGSSRGRRSRVMACTLTGRNLLCYSISMAVAFLDLVLIQLEIFPPGGSGCVVLGNQSLLYSFIIP